MITAGCERLGIEVPIIQAPMGGAVGPALAAAVSNAGGLGTLALWAADIQTLRQQVRETRALTAKPFAVNLVLEFPQEERLEACLQEGVPVISFFWREPSALVARAKSGGGIVLHRLARPQRPATQWSVALTSLSPKDGKPAAMCVEKLQRCHSFPQWSMLSGQFQL
jgi:NAD(P)H-dependent flavin oxidoreductase YrpB (nitropropane dioxygenase family)